MQATCGNYRATLDECRETLLACLDDDLRFTVLEALRSQFAQLKRLARQVDAGEARLRPDLEERARALQGGAEENLARVGQWSASVVRVCECSIEVIK